MRTVIFGSLMLLASSIHGQSYHSFLHDMAIWDETVVEQCEPGLYLAGYDRKLIMEGDTTINSLSYKKLYYQNYHSFILQNLQTIVDQYYAYPPTLAGAVREDSSKKVYFYQFDTTFFIPTPCAGNEYIQSEEVLLYDFDLEVGDTVIWKPYSPLVVDIDTLTIADTVNLTIFRFNDEPNMEDFWTESLGSSFGFFGAYLPPHFECYCQLNCVAASDFIMAGELPCGGIYTGIVPADIKDQHLTVFPNPASKHETITLTGLHNCDGIIEVLDAYGRVVLVLKSNGESQERFPATSLAGGVYLIRYKGNNGERSFTTFVIRG